MKEMRYFLAHRKDEDDDQINFWLEELTDLLQKLRPDVVVKVVAGRDDYQQRAKMLGGWQAWQRSVAAGCRTNGEPEFHAVIVPGVSMGRATAEIVSTTLKQGKAAAVYQNGNLKRVAQVVTIDKKDWISGWTCQTS